MGDRRQIHFEDMNLWFYSHWGGHDMPQDLQKAIIKAKDRWGDEPYCLRIIISQMIGKGWDDNEGDGLSNSYMDSNYSSDLIVNIEKQTVEWKNYNWPFQRFVELKPSDFEEIEEEE